MAYLSSIILAFVVFIFGWIPPAFGQEKMQSLLDLLDKPLPEIEFISKQAFEEQTKLVEETPLGDKYLAYRMRLPKSWEKKENPENISIAKNVLTEISSYISPLRAESARSEFKVHALELHYDITATHWFLQHLSSQAYNVVGVKEHSPDRVEAVYAVIRKGTTFVVRSVAIKNGSRIILAEFYVPQGQWQNERVIQAQGMAGFKLPNNDTGYVQELEKFKFLDIAQISFPERWEVSSPNLNSIERMDVKLLNVNRAINRLNGQVDIYVVLADSVSSLEEELVKIKTILAEKNLHLGRFIKTADDFKFDEKMKFGIVESYVAQNKEQKFVEYELWLAVMASEKYYYFMPMLTHRRSGDFTLWARNLADFRIMVENLRYIKDEPLFSDYDE